MPSMRSDRTTKLLFGGTILLLLLLLVIIYRTLTQYREENFSIRRTHRALRELETVLSTVKDAESAYRGFLLTRDTSYLEPFRSATELVQQHVGLLSALVHGQDQRQRVDSLDFLVREQFDMIRSILVKERRARSGLDRSDRELLDASKANMDGLRALHLRLSEGESAVLEHKQTQERISRVMTPLVMLLYGLLAILAVTLLFRRVFQAVERAKEAEQEIQRKVDQLNIEVATREMAERSLKRVLDSSISAIMALRAVRDKHGAIVDLEWTLANPRTGELLGSSEDALIGRRLLEVMPATRSLGLFEHYAKVIDNGLPLHMDLHYDADGIDRWLEVTAVRLLDGLVVTLTDITEQKRREELAQESERLAITGRIARTIAHEVRNPLTNLQLALEQIQEERLLENGASVYTDIIRRNTDRIGQLITEMIASSRQRQLDLKPTQLGELLNETADLFRDRLELKRMKLEVRVEEGLPLVLVDRENMKLALLNICINAIEAMDPDRGVLWIGATREEGVPVIRVRDNGKGIAPDELEGLFEPFYTGKAGGMGLGLTTARSILNSHRVHIEVSSELLQGTTFTLRFPVEG